MNSIAHLLVTTVTGTDGAQHEQVFDRLAVIPYAYRHSYAQRHADEGVPPDVLRDLLGHDKIGTTLGYYRVSEKRVRIAIDRMRVGQVAVPFGICTEPSNVKAGGQACPHKFTCLGCGHFRSDPSVLAENANLHEQNRRLAQQIADLEDRLSELLGQQAFDRSGLGAPAGTPPSTPSSKASARPSWTFGECWKNATRNSRRPARPTGG